LDSPVIAAEVVDPKTVIVPPPGTTVTVYPVMRLPPSLAGAVQVTVADRLPGVAVPMTGELGTVAGVTAADSAEKAPSTRSSKPTKHR